MMPSPIQLASILDSVGKDVFSESYGTARTVSIRVCGEHRKTPVESQVSTGKRGDNARHCDS
jgi:hypothetical protein